MTQFASSTPTSGVSRFPSKPLPPRAGAGLKTGHIDAILADDYRIGFLEVHAENYMGDGGPAHRALAAIRAEFPLSVHGVGLSIGSRTGLDPDHLDRLARVVERYEPGMVSEHLAWSSHDAGYFNDLLPLPYDQATLDLVAGHIGRVQDRLKRPILLENPSTYVAFEQSTMSETDFIREVARKSGCGLLLDINNVFVSATNHGWKPLQYLRDFPLELVEEIHLAGHAEDTDDEGDLLLIDAHDRPVADPVWKLYEIVISQAGPLPTLIEWDNDVPEWPVLRHEAKLAEAILDRLGPASMLGSRHAAE
ncbi:MAG: DUF692 domain-containing protein [Hoeflea sp.]|jgi:hypothetical protein|uniref:MNIO family bufferin maturase n=1 Tax=Hoeflea sp. TaxID=1940281 RepID=UPI0032EF4AE5